MHIHPSVRPSVCLDWALGGLDGASGGSDGDLGDLG